MSAGRRGPAARRPSLGSLAPAIALLAAALLTGGCGGGGAASRAGPRTPLTVDVDQTLKPPFEAYAKASPDTDPKIAYLPLGTIVGRVRRGEGPDVIVARDSQLPQSMYDEGKVELPVRFASDAIAIASPAGDTKVQGLDDLAKPGARIAIASDGTQLGMHTRALIARLPRAQRTAILANVRVRSRDAAGLVGALTHHTVDAALLYHRTVQATNRPAVDAGHPCCVLYESPAGRRPYVEYSAAITVGARHDRAARLFLYGLLSDPGRTALSDAGYSAPTPPN